MFKFPLDPGISRALIVFAAVTGAVSTVVVLSSVYKSASSDENMLKLREMTSWSRKIDEANRHNQILVEHEDKFKELVRNSVIGEEDRLSWVEIVQTVADSRKLTSVKYNIAKQSLLDSKMLDREYRDIDVFRSAMSLDMKLLHEGDLFAMLNALFTKAKGLVTVDKCDIELINKDLHEGVALLSDVDNIRANCNLSWYTLKQAGKG